MATGMDTPSTSSTRRSDDTDHTSAPRSTAPAAPIAPTGVLMDSDETPVAPDPDAAARAVRSRLAQGLQPGITDLPALVRIARLMSPDEDADN